MGQGRVNWPGKSRQGVPWVQCNHRRAHGSEASWSSSYGQRPQKGGDNGLRQNSAEWERNFDGAWPSEHCRISRIRGKSTDREHVGSFIFLQNKNKNLFHIDKISSIRIRGNDQWVFIRIRSFQGRRYKGFYASNIGRHCISSFERDNTQSNIFHENLHFHLLTAAGCRFRIWNRTTFSSSQQEFVKSLTLEYQRNWN